MTGPHLEIGIGELAAPRAFFGAAPDWPSRHRSRDRWKAAPFGTPGGPIGVHGDGPDGGVVPEVTASDMAALGRVRAAGGRVEGEAADVVACRDPRGTRFGRHRG